MKTYIGNVEITKENQEEWKEKLKGVKKITGDCYLHASASLPALTTIGGYCYLHVSASLKADALTTIGGDCSLSASASLPALTTIGGDCSLSASASLKADALIKGKKVDTKPIVRKAFYKHGYLFADGILSNIVSKRKAENVVIWKTTKIGSDKVVYVVQRGEIFSHGETVKQASHDLHYKLDGNRDTSEYKKWTLTTVKPIAELIQAYRVITGSCETGTKQWCEGKNLPAKASVKVAIRLTRGAYQAGKFAEFFKVKP